MRFATDVKLTGPYRSPAQMLAEQVVDGHLSVHDMDQAAALGLAGAPIEGPTHFSQVDPLAVFVWGDDWFTRGCISAHFQNMVVAGEQVQATLSVTTNGPAPVSVHKQDGTSVLVGTASVGPDYRVTELDDRRSRSRPAGRLHILDQMEVGMVRRDSVSMTFDEPNGPLYPFSLADKLARITEPHPWYSREGSRRSPWGRPIVPMEMVSVMCNKVELDWPIRSPAIGLYLDLEIRLLDGPVLVDQDYSLQWEIVGLSQGPRTESYWTQATLTTPGHDPVAQVLLHTGLFKDSYPLYPRDEVAKESER
jgi:hypothetical protein